MESFPQELLGIGEPGQKVPDTRVLNAESARKLITSCIWEDDIRSRHRALVAGLVGGNPPYNDAKRKASGLGWTANINFMEGLAIMELARVPYYGLFASAKYYAECRTALGLGTPENEQWSSHITANFHGMLKRWTQFDWQMQQSQYQMLLHGLGPCVFDRKGDWRFRSRPSGSLLAPQGAASCIDERLPFVILRDQFRIHELYDRIRNEDAAKAAGWDVETTKDVIRKYGKGMLNNTALSWRQAPWELFQEHLRNNDLLYSHTSSDIVWVGHLFVREFSGSITHMIVTETELAETGGDNGVRDGFLFKDPNAYDSYDQCIIAFFQNIGDGTWHSVRGIASKAFKHLECSNRLKCRMLDGSFIESSLVLKTGTTKNAEKLQLMQVGPVTYLPPGAEIQQTKVSGFLDGPMTMDRLLGNHLSNNLGMFMPRTMTREDGRGEQPTATQVNQQVAKEATLSGGQISLYCLTGDRLYAEMFRRALTSSDSEAKRFRQECADAGVPKEALTNMLYVRMSRDAGYGSQQMRILSDQQLMPLLPMFPEEGKRNYLKMAVATIKGPDKVDLLVPDQHIPNEDDSIAAMENAMIAMGRQPIVSTGQDHVIHLHSHLADAAQVLEPVGNAMEAGQTDAQALQQAFQYTQILAGHVQEHLAQIVNDPSRKDLAKLFKEQLNNVVSFSGKLHHAVIAAQHNEQQQAMEQQQATALGALDQAKIESMHVDNQIKEAKTQHQMQMSQMKTNYNLRLKGIATAEQIRQQRVKERMQPEAA